MQASDSIKLTIIFSLVVSTQSSSKAQYEVTFSEIENLVYIRSNTKKDVDASYALSKEIYNESYFDLAPAVTANYSKSVLEGHEPVETKSISLGYNVNSLLFYPMTHQWNSLNYKISKIDFEYSQMVYKKKFRDKLIELQRSIKTRQKYESLLAIQVKDFKSLEKRYKRGAISKLKYLKSKDTLEKIRNDSENAQRNYSTTVLNFTGTYKLTKTETDKILNFKNNIKNKLFLHSESMRQKLKELDLHSNRPLKKLSLDKKRNLINKNLKINSYLPNLSLGYTHQLNHQSPTFSLTVSLDMTGIVKDSMTFKKSYKDHLKSIYAYEDGKIFAENERRRLIDQIDTQLANYNYVLSALERSEEILSLTKESFNKGKKQGTNLNTAWRSYLNALNAALNVKYDLMKKINEVEFFISDLSDGNYIF